MKFSKNTIAVLKNFATINPSIHLTPGNLVRTANRATTNYAHATIEDNIDIECAIHDLAGFLSILQLADAEANVTVVDGSLAIRGERSVIYWPTIEVEKILTPARTAVFPPGTIEFELKADDWSQFTRVSRALAVDLIAVSKKDDRIVMDGYNRITDADLANPLVSLDMGECPVETQFKFVLHMQNMKIPVDDYKVKFFAKDKQIASCFESASALHIISVEKTSSHSF